MIYISTNLTNGNENIPLVNQENEWDQAIREYNFIKKVLCRLPHNVAFKPYPEDTRKYLDLPITTSLAKKSKNITVVGENFDARFLIKILMCLLLQAQLAHWDG